MYKRKIVTASLTISKDFVILVKDGDEDYERIFKEQCWTPENILNNIGWITDEFCINYDEDTDIS